MRSLRLPTALTPAVLALLAATGCASIAGPIDTGAGNVAVDVEMTKIEAVLDDLHAAAAEADEERYFSLFAPTGVFFGTDAAERWTRDQFRAYAHPHFSQGKGWTYHPRDRHVAVSAGGDTAWFDELLDNAKYGECRGTGVLQRHDGAWKIEQYHLTIPIPNELAGDFVARIREHAAAADPHPGPLPSNHR